MNQEKLMTILLEPRVTEKSTLIGEAYNQYVFKVAREATKPEIKQAVELMFDGAEVVSVQVMNVKGKKKMFARRLGQRVNWKKAYVKLKSGFDIDFMGA
jgi:large subunit ribosomal protein L23|tara:strand:+ start:113 stop:409 length:297 start_codon:yes stop_codon:yes gene_type:complete